MPPANPGGYFHTESSLDVGNIADIQQIDLGTTDIVFKESREYLGVRLVLIAPHHQRNAGPKRQKLETRAVVLGQSHNQSGKMALLIRPSTIFQTVVGTEMKQDGGIKVGQVHWCSALQIKWVSSITKSTQVETGLYKEKLLQEARVKLAKDLLNLLEEGDGWSDIDWEKVETTIDDIQPLLDVANSPKKRQQQGGKESKKKTGNRNNDRAEISQTGNANSGREDFLEDEDWTDNSKHIRRCKFDIDESVKLDDEEKARVKILVYQYMAKEPMEFEKHNHELAKLLDKAFPAKFDIGILQHFTAASKVNFDFLGVQTFAEFASWWDARAIESLDDSAERSPSPAEELPGGHFMNRARNLVAAFLQVPII